MKNAMLDNVLEQFCSHSPTQNEHQKRHRHEELCSCRTRGYRKRQKQRFGIYASPVQSLGVTLEMSSMTNLTNLFD